MNRFWKYLSACLVLSLFIVFPAMAKKSLNKVELLGLGGNEMIGVVEDIGVYNFMVRNSSGEIINFHTDGKLTQFAPKDERLVIGDKVNIIYVGAESASKAIDRQYAFLIEFEEMAQRNFITGKTDCVVMMSVRGTKTCYLPEYDKLITVEGLYLDGVSYGKSKHRIKLKVVPAKVGNGYVYKARSID